MDIIEFAEKFMNIELLEYQKVCLREFEKLKADGKIRVVTGRKGQCYIYPDQNVIKELTQNGKTLDCHNQMSVVR